MLAQWIIDEISVDERKRMITYCIACALNSMESIARFCGLLSANLYLGKKHEQLGFEGLEDRRGKRKAEECLSEFEITRRRIKPFSHHDRY